MDTKSKQMAAWLDSSDDEGITVEQFRQPPRKSHREPLKDTNVSQAQNRKQRRLECVLIPAPHRPSQLSPIRLGIPTYKVPQHTNRQRTSGSQQLVRHFSYTPGPGCPEPMADRPRRSNAVPRSYAEQDMFDQNMPDLSDDEAAASPVLSRKRKRDVDSDFDGEAESEARESEEEQSGEEDETPSEAEEYSDEGYKSAPKKQGISRGTPKLSAPPVTEAKKNKTGKGRSSGTASAAMCKLLRRAPSEPKGLDLRLPPLSDIKSIFMDITKKGLNNGLLDALKDIGARPIRTATMCSGTEAPLLALEMFSDCLRDLGAARLEIEHLFSAEIVPYKQAYIERNFHSPIIFRDITEMIDAAETPDPHATDAWGALQRIPADIDILVAGTSCVDFSNLNKHRKVLDIENGGESSKTWFAVLAYSKKFRPAIVLLENVLHGPWDEMTDHYRRIGYEVAGVLVDTKNYYLPQTRQRGYLVCFDKSKAEPGHLDDVGTKWQSLMGEFRRNASSPVTDFLLPNDVVRVKEQSTMDDTAKEYDWRACQIRHLQYRNHERLGNDRPFTKWLEGGGINVPEQGSSDWWRKQVERVRDAYEIAILRKAKEYDARFKTRIPDLSQNVDMMKDTTQFGGTPCLTPSGIFFDTYSGRALAPEELMRLQGLPADKISFTIETRSELQDLAGNAMSTPVAGSGILAAIISGYKVLCKSTASGPAVTSFSDERARSKLSIVQADTESVVDMRSTLPEIDIAGLREAAARSVQRCVCEGLTRLARDPLQHCKECGHTSCTACGGNPSHQYALAPETRQDPVGFEQELRSMLPLQLRLTTSNDGQSQSSEFDSIFQEATVDEFSFSHVTRKRQWTAVYTAPTARLHLVIGKAIEWQLFALADDTLPANAELRANFEQPIARCAVTDRLLSGKWLCRTLFPRTQGIRIRGTGELIPSWRSKIGMPDYQEEKVWDQLEITVLDRFEATLASTVSGLYKALPDCGTSSDSLYKRINATEGEAVYLFEDPTKTGDPSLDCFVFSQEHEKLDYGDTRPIVASLAPVWKPWASDKDFQHPQLSGPSWQPASIRMIEVVPDLQIQRPRQLVSRDSQLSCARAEFIARCSTPTTSNSTSTTANVFKDYAFALEAMRRQLPNEQWRELDPQIATKACSGVHCAPSRPELRWMWTNDGTIKPYEDTNTAGEYETAMKDRPDPIVLEAEGGKLSFGINLASLAHRAAARLPAGVVSAKVSWMMQQTTTGARLKPFKLRPTSGPRFDRNLGLNFQLFPKQRLVLGWMLKQEAGQGQRFMIEEADEAIVPFLGWRAEVRAEAPIDIRGGICADHPGFGKTITSLALIHTGLQSSDAAILEDLERRQAADDASIGLLPTKATLIVTPHSLTKQWISEIKDKLGYQSDVILINAVKDLSKYSVSDFEQANIVIVSRSVLGSEEYADRLGAFASLPGPATQSGRAFTQWLQHACKQIPEHLEILNSRGVIGLEKHITNRFTELQQDEKLKAKIPSRRLVGAQFAAQAVSKTKAKTKQSSKDQRPAKLPIGHLKHPLFEMFYFNRVIIDEFQLSSPREYASIKAIKADKRWGLSATPALRDSFDIAYLAGLLNIPLRISSASTRYLTAANIKNRHRDMTDFERFEAARQMPSDSMHTRIHEHGQEFLDAFCRQNVQDFEIPFEEHLVPVTLDQSHQAEYAELFSHLSSQDMNIMKAKASSSTARDVRFNDAVGDIKVAEEVLSRAAAYHDGRTISQLIESCTDETERTLKHLRTAAVDARRQPNAALDEWEATLLEQGTLGDDDAILEVQQILQAIPSKAKPTAPKRKKARTQADSGEDTEEPTNGSGSKTTQNERNLTAEVNTLAKCLRTSIREARYFKNIRFLQQVLTKAKHWQCDGQACSNDGYYKAAVSPVCGHLICEGCHEDREGASICPAAGCDASVDDHHLQWWDKYGSTGQANKHGAKIQTALSIIQRIYNDGQKAILFVQYPEQLSQVAEALSERDIPATILTSKGTSASIASFVRNDHGVIVINASDETAAGLNLQIANHVIFLSPLLRQQQYDYDATMAQAIGRVRRHGQLNSVHVHRIFALRTIDVDILEHRERCTSAITERGASDITPAPAVSMLNQRVPPKPERMQLVKDEDGTTYSLRPRSWLTRCDTDHTDVQFRDRVAGWEDFSSQVKWTAKFLEDDAALEA